MENYKCDNCNKEFNNYVSFKVHAQKTHKINAISPVNSGVIQSISITIRRKWPLLSLCS